MCVGNPGLSSSQHTSPASILNGSGFLCNTYSGDGDLDYVEYILRDDALSNMFFRCYHEAMVLNKRRTVYWNSDNDIISLHVQQVRAVDDTFLAETAFAGLVMAGLRQYFKK